MEELASELLKELNCDTAFSIKLPAGLPLIGGVQLDIAESVVITWVVMAVILILSIILTSNLKVHNVSRRQLVAETIVTKLEGIVTGMIGEEGKRYVPYLVSVLLYLGISNIIGLFGMKPPTKDLNVTAASMRILPGPVPERDLRSYDLLLVRIKIPGYNMRWKESAKESVIVVFGVQSGSGCVSRS